MRDMIALCMVLLIGPILGTIIDAREAQDMFKLVFTIGGGVLVYLTMIGIILANTNCSCKKG